MKNQRLGGFGGRDNSYSFSASTPVGFRTQTSRDLPGPLAWGDPWIDVGESQASKPSRNGYFPHWTMVAQGAELPHDWGFEAREARRQRHTRPVRGEGGQSELKAPGGLSGGGLEGGGQDALHTQATDHERTGRDLEHEPEHEPTN